MPKRRVHGGVRHRATLTCIVYADPTADVSSDEYMGLESTYYQKSPIHAANFRSSGMSGKGQLP